MANSTIDFLTNRRPDAMHRTIAPNSTPKNRRHVGRLAWYMDPVDQIEVDKLAHMIEQQSLPDAQFVVDTCFLTGMQLTPRLWAALLLGRVLIPPMVWLELQPWLENPIINRFIRDQLLDAKSHGHPHIHFLSKLDTSLSTHRGASYYIELLGFRKKIFELAPDHLRKIYAREPTDEEIDRWVQKFVQDRGLVLAKKGRDDKGKTNFLADEETVVYSILSCLETGHETTILTRDNDLIEQFYKCIYLLDTHYHSMLLAKAYFEQPLNFFAESVPAGFPILTVDTKDASFVRRPIISQEFCLPNNPSWVMLYCYCLGGTHPPYTFTSLAFGGEREMLTVFEMKGKTKGKNTNLFGDCNFHICVDPMAQSDWGSVCMLARDRLFTASNDMEWSLIDSQLSFSRNERISQVEYVQAPKASESPQYD